MPQNRTRRLARALNRSKLREYGEVVLKVKIGPKFPYSDSAIYSDDWDLQHIVDIPEGIDFWELTVIDQEDTRGTKLSSATAFSVRGEVYDSKAVDPPKGMVPIWVFKLAATSNRDDG